MAASRDTKQDFEFFAVPDPQINAFALPGGFIGVHTGLILLAQNESELASVLAHEISHVTQRHMARMVANQKNSMLLSLAGLALAILASRAGGSNGGQGVQAAIASTQALAAQTSSTSRARTSTKRTGSASRDWSPPDSIRTAWRSSWSGCSAPAASPKATRLRTLRTHPITYERIAEAQSRAQGVPYRQVPGLARVPSRCARC